MSQRQPEVADLDIEELHAMVARSETSALGAEDREKLSATIDSFSWLLSELEKKRTTLAYLRKSFSINTPKTEKTSEVLKNVGAEQPSNDPGQQSDGESDQIGDKPKKKPKGHGRNGADDYKGADKVEVPHESLKPGDPCSECVKGKVYLQKPQRLIRLRGQPPIAATLFELETLRCNLCGKQFIATPPADMGEEKYDPTSVSMIALLKYGSGLPFNRIAKLEGNLGIPLPASTQWDYLNRAAQVGVLVYDELGWYLANGGVIYHDDTTMKILSLLKENQRIRADGSGERTGIFTTGFVGTFDGHKIAIFRTGRQHAGENLRDLLEKRSADLDAPIQMCDGSSRNEMSLHTFLANCLAHGRRKFVEVAQSFPPECRYVLETLRLIYKNDDVCREEKMSPGERLCYHQAHSAKPMADLKHWMSGQFEERKVEPNSSLGGAFSYMLKRWDKLTLFLRQPGAPLDNNICERALKKAILHRKNALFYKTENGARVGDIFMSLIYTAELSGENPFDYLVALHQHPEQVRSAPHQWLPWNYRETLAALAKAPANDIFIQAPARTA